MLHAPPHRPSRRTQPSELPLQNPTPGNRARTRATAARSTSTRHAQARARALGLANKLYGLKPGRRRPGAQGRCPRRSRHARARGSPLRPPLTPRGGARATQQAGEQAHRLPAHNTAQGSSESSGSRCSPRVASLCAPRRAVRVPAAPPFRVGRAQGPAAQGVERDIAPRLPVAGVYLMTIVRLFTPSHGNEAALSCLSGRQHSPPMSRLPRGGRLQVTSTLAAVRQERAGHAGQEPCTRTGAQVSACRRGIARGVK